MTESVGFEHKFASPPVCIGDSNEAFQDEERRSFLQRSIAALIVASAGASLLFEQSPANEALRINIGLDVLQGTQSSVAVGATIAAVTAGIEMGSSGLISLGLHSKGGAVRRLKDKLTGRNKEIIEVEGNEDLDTSKKASVLGKIANEGANVGIALGLGAGLVTMKEHVRDPDPTLAKDLKTSAKAAGIVSAVSGAIGYLAAGGISHAQGTIFERPAELFVDYGTDTKFWIGALVVGYGAAFVKKRISAFRARRDKGIENDTARSM